MGQRVLIVDDDHFTRMALSAVLTSLGYEVVADVGSVINAMDVGRTMRPDLAVLDLDLGEGPTGIDLAHGLRGLLPNIGLVMLSSYADPRFIGKRSRPLPEGAVFITKQQLGDASVLDQAIQRALMLDSVDENQSTLPESDDNLVVKRQLTDTQIELMRLVAAGFSNAEIARRLWITEAGVNRAITRLVKQLDLDVTKERNPRVLIARTYAELAGRSVAHE